MERAIGLAEGQPVPGAPHPSWVVRERVAAGGFGEVWRAEGQALDGSGETISIAVKWFPEPEHARLFEKEAAAVEELQRRLPSHPNIVRMLAVNRQVAPAWIAYEFVHGGSLRDALEAGTSPQSWPQIRAQFEQILAGVDAAHQAGIVHGDLSPGNVLIDRKGTPRIADFGLARVTHAPIQPMAGEDAASCIARSGLNRSFLGLGGGTRLYMSPEQEAGEPITPQDDVHALSVILLQLLAGDATLDPRFARATLERRGRPGLRVPTEVRRSLLTNLEGRRTDRAPNATALRRSLQRRTRPVVSALSWIALAMWLLPLLMVAVVLVGGLDPEADTWQHGSADSYDAHFDAYGIKRSTPDERMVLAQLVEAEFREFRADPSMYRAALHGLQYRVRLEPIELLQPFNDGPPRVSLHVDGNEVAQFPEPGGAARVVEFSWRLGQSIELVVDFPGLDHGPHRVREVGLMRVDRLLGKPIRIADNAIVRADLLHKSADGR